MRPVRPPRVCHRAPGRGQSPARVLLAHTGWLQASTGHAVPRWHAAAARIPSACAGDRRHGPQRSQPQGQMHLQTSAGQWPGIEQCGGGDQPVVQGIDMHAQPGSGGLGVVAQIQLGQQALGQPATARAVMGQQGPDVGVDVRCQACRIGHAGGAECGDEGRQTGQQVDAFDMAQPVQQAQAPLQIGQRRRQPSPGGAGR